MWFLSRKRDSDRVAPFMVKAVELASDAAMTKGFFLMIQGVDFCYLGDKAA